MGVQHQPILLANPQASYFSLAAPVLVTVEPRAPYPGTHGSHGQSVPQTDRTARPRPKRDFALQQQFRVLANSRAYCASLFAIDDKLWLQLATQSTTAYMDMPLSMSRA